MQGIKILMQFPTEANRSNHMSQNDPNKPESSVSEANLFDATNQQSQFQNTAKLLF